MFEYQNNILCVEAGWLYNDGEIMTFHTYKTQKRRDFITIARRGCKGTPALVEYDNMPTRFKNLIIEKHGDPHKTTKHSSFKDLIQNNTNHYDYFFTEFTLSNGSHLPDKTKREYYANAIILNTCHKISNDNTSRRKAMGGRSSTKLWDRLAVIIQDLDKVKYPHSLPTNARRLKAKYKDYMFLGLPALIHKNFCNTNSEKINDEAKMWVISRWANPVDKCPNIDTLHSEYNRIAKEKGWKVLKDGKSLHTFINKEDIKPLWYGNRYGDAAKKEKYTYQHSTILPTMRDSLWYSDGTKLNYYYLDNAGEIKTCQVYEVIDAFSEVFLGYHISPTENFEAQYASFKMAVQVSEQRPYQIGFDGQGGHKKLQAGSFMDKLTRLPIKTAPYNGRSKTIESAFKRFQTQFMKRDWFFTGQNITAKTLESKQNREFILANKHLLPTLNEVKAVYAKRRQEWNEAPHPKTGIPRLEMYRNSINPQAEKVGLWEMVDMFWMLREKPVTLSMYGLSITEKGDKSTYVKYTDDLPDVEWMSKNVDKKFYIKYDPQDMSLIHLYDKDALGLRHVTEMSIKLEVHRGKQEQEDWEAEYFDKIKKANETVRVKSAEEMDDILFDNNQHPNQSGFNTPALLGINSKNRKAKTKPAASIGKVQKKISNVVSIESDDEEIDYLSEM